jgi:hypothetical protein
MTRGSLGGAFAREKRSRSVDVLRNGARAVGEATRPSPEPAVARFSLENSPDPSSSRARRTEISGITRVDDSDRSFFRFRAEIFFDVRAVWKFRRSGPRTRRWVWKRKKNPNLRPSILSSPSRHLKFERSDADPRPIKRPERRHAKKRRMALAARGAVPRHISTRVYASARTHKHQNGLHVSLHEGRGRRE